MKCATILAGVAAFLHLWGIVVGSAAAESRLAARTDLSGAGTAVHMRDFSATPDAVKQLADAGVRILRTDLFWDATEKVRGRYDWSAYDYKLRHLAEQNIRPLLILDYSNPLYTGNTNTHVPPRTAEEIAAFSEWAAAAVKHFAPLDPIWEIWNEPDIPQFWRPEPAVEQYMALASPACEAMRAANPDAAIIGPALAVAPIKSNIDSQVFARLVLRNGPLMRCLDAFSFHPYRFDAPETFLTDMTFYKTLAADGQSFTGVEKPFVVTEWGYSTYRGTKITDEIKAAYLVRQQFVAILAGTPLMISYNWQDIGDDPTNREFNFGILKANGSPKLSWNALVELKTQLGGYQLDKVMSASDDGYVLAFKSPAGDIKIVAWRAVGEASLSIAGSTPVEAISMYGDDLPATSDANGTTLPIGRDPIYLTVGGALPTITIH